MRREGGNQGKESNIKQLLYTTQPNQQHKTEYNNNYKLFKILHRFKLQSSYRYGSDGEGKDVGNAGDGDCHAGVL